jgi:DNA-binding CsgD family transcriptional regulator
VTTQLLTPAQVRVIAGYARGRRTREIAADTHVTPKAVRSHLIRAAARAGLPGYRQAALVDHAYARGYLTNLQPETRPPASVAGRQLQVLRLLAEGLTAEEIAVRLGVKPSTVIEHCNRLYAALGARHRAHAVALGWQAGLLGPDRKPAR